MKYARQVQEALDRLDQSLASLRNLIKRGEKTQAINYMEEGDLKERFEELQNIILVATTSPLGARGTAGPGTI